MRDRLTQLLSIVLSPSSATRRQRRTLGIVVLVLVVTFVLLGCVFLKAGVSPGTSLLWWAICFVLMTWSLYLAYLDVKSIKHDLRSQKKELFLSIFSQPGSKANRREKGKGGPSSEKSGGEHQRGTKAAPRDPK